MNARQLYEALGGLDDDVVMEALKKKRNAKQRTMNRTIGIAASLAILVISAGIFYTVGTGHLPFTSPTDVPAGPETSVPAASVTPAPSPASSVPTTLEVVVAAYYDVLMNGGEFYSVDLQKSVLISQLSELVTNESLPVSVLKFTVLDLDHDGSPEVALWLKIGENESIGCAVLHWMDETMYGYALWSRAFNSLKADGSFSFSSSAAESGFGTLSFTVSGYTVDRLAYSEADNGAATTPDQIRYYYDGQRVSEADFGDVCSRQSHKADMLWYEYTEANILAMLAASDESSPRYVAESFIPSQRAQSVEVPDFLDAEQQLLYRRAFTLYEGILGGSNSGVEELECAGVMLQGSSEYSHEDIGRSPHLYARSQGAYQKWTDFDRLVHSVFTDAFWTAKNSTAQGEEPLYVDVGGLLYFMIPDRGASSSYNGNLPDGFLLRERTDTRISFSLFVHYTAMQPEDGEATDERDMLVRQDYEYTRELPLTMVLTEDGWRFDNFYIAPAEEAPPEPSHKPWEEAYDAKILQGDLSDFAGIWANGRGDSVTLSPDGTFYGNYTEDGVTYKEIAEKFSKEQSGYMWGVHLENYAGPSGYTVWFYPAGAEVWSYYGGYIPTDTTRDRLYAGHDFYTDMSGRIFYLRQPAQQPLTEDDLLDLGYFIVDSDDNYTLYALPHEGGGYEHYLYRIGTEEPYLKEGIYAGTTCAIDNINGILRLRTGSGNFGRTQYFDLEKGLESDLFPADAGFAEYISPTENHYLIAYIAFDTSKEGSPAYLEIKDIFAGYVAKIERPFNRGTSPLNELRFVNGNEIYIEYDRDFIDGEYVSIDKWINEKETIQFR